MKQGFTKAAEFIHKFFTKEHFPLGKLSSSLLTIVTILAFYSYRSSPFKIFNTEIKQSGIKEFFTPALIVKEKQPIALKKNTQPKENPVDTSSQRFLLIGDSMLETLGLRLNDYCSKNNHTMNMVIWYSSSTLWYGNCDTISHFIKQFNPTYVILVIGANELMIKDINNREKYVKHILDQIGTKKYIWVGPPNWREDTGINDLILKNVGTSRYYPSNKLTYERKKDGAHPTPKSGAAWMDSLAVFMMKGCMNPVVMKYPDTPATKRPPTILLAPKPPAGL